MKKKYWQINTDLGKTGAGLTVEQLKHNSELSNILGMSHLNVCRAYTDWPSRSEKLKSDYKLPEWELLHRFWRTLPNFNPHAVSSEPSQDLGAEAQDLMFLPW